MTTTTPAAPLHVTHVGTDLGVGRVVRPDGNAHVFVQWPGIAMARRQHIEEIEAYVPAPEPVRRRRAR